MGWTAPKTWSVGETLTAANFNAHIRDNMNALTRFVGKTADESVVSSTVLQDDDHLFFAMGANEWYFVAGILWHESASTPHLKFGFTIPASGDYHVNAIGVDTGGSAFVQQNLRSVADNGQFFSGPTGHATQFFGVAQTAGTSGNFQLQFAQNISNASAIVLKKGSAMWFQKVV